MHDSASGPAQRPNLDSQKVLSDLRRRAEQRHLATQSLPANSSAEVQALIQELEMYQLELEVQVQELLQTQAEAETSRAQYADLYQFAPVGYCSLAPDSTLLQLNLRVSQLLHLTHHQLLGRRLAVFVSEADRHTFADFLAAVFATKQRQVTTLEVCSSENQCLQLQLEGDIAIDEYGTAYCRLVVFDVTEQHRTRQELEHSERRFRTLFESNKDGMLLLRDNHFVDCNAAVLDMLGLASKEQLLQQHASAYSPETQPNGQDSFKLADRCWEEALRQGFYRFEWCRLRADGSEFWEDILLTTIPEAGTPTVHATWRDITLEKTAIRQLRLSEERLQQALDAASMGVWTRDLTTDALYWDARAQAIFGRSYSAAPASFSDLWSTIHPDDRPMAEQLLRQVQLDQPTDTEYRIIWPDGSLHYVAIISRLLPANAKNDTPRQLTGLMRDVTTQRQAEIELHSQNRLLRHILSNMPVILSRLTPEGEFLEMAGAGLRRMNIADNQLVGENILAVFPSFIEHSRRLLAGQQVSFVGIVKQDGEQYYFQKHGFFDQQRQQAILFSIDITEVERHRALLQTERDFTKSLLDNSTDVIMAFRADDLRITAWNREASRLTGVEEADALNRPFFELFDQLEHDTEFNALLTAALTGKAAKATNWYGRRFEGYFDLNLMPLIRPADSPGGFLFVARDVTERYNMQAETMDLKLRQQQEVLSAILITQEEERRRIAEGLHNGVGQLLYATRLHLNSLPPDEPVRTTQRILDDAIRATRNISFELTPGILEDFGLSVALHELVKRIPAHTLRVNLNLSGLHENLPNLFATAVYRIVQELLNNIMKHAQAQEAFVQVTQTDGHVYLSVEDDGVGFDTEQNKMPRGIGLSGIRTRVGLLGGTFMLRSTPGQGTSLSLVLPLTNK